MAPEPKTSGGTVRNDAVGFEQTEPPEHHNQEEKGSRQPHTQGQRAYHARRVSPGGDHVVQTRPQAGDNSQQHHDDQCPNHILRPAPNRGMITPPARPARPARQQASVRPLLLMLLGVAVFGMLGTWQLNRSGERSAALQAFGQAGSATPVEGLDRVSPQGDYLRVRLSGRYAGDRQVLMDNMTHEGMRGYHVLTPLHMAGGIVLVNRGFAPAGMDRSQLPDIAVDSAEREVTGVTAPYFRSGLRLEEPEGEGSWPRRMTYPAAEPLRALIDGRLPDYQILLDSNEPDGFVRVWRPYGLSPQRHLAYAVQWYGLGAAAVGIWLAVTFKRRRAQHEN